MKQKFPLSNFFCTFPFPKKFPPLKFSSIFSCAIPPFSFHLFSFHFPIYSNSNSYFLLPLPLYLVPFSLFHVPVPNFQIPNPNPNPDSLCRLQNSKHTDSLCRQPNTTRLSLGQLTYTYRLSLQAIDSRRSPTG